MLLAAPHHHQLPAPLRRQPQPLAPTFLKSFGRRGSAFSQAGKDFPECLGFVPQEDAAQHSFFIEQTVLHRLYQIVLLELCLLNICCWYAGGGGGGFSCISNNSGEGDSGRKTRRIEQAGGGIVHFSDTSPLCLAHFLP